MSPGLEFGKKMMEAARTDFVEFKFKGEDGKMVRTLKSFLSTRSPIFAAQFNETWYGDTVDIDDPVSFDQHRQFRLFIQVLCGLTEMVQISVYDAACLYFYAEKYQIDDMKAKLIATLPILNRPSNDIHLLSCLEFVTENNFPAMLTAVDGIKLDLDDENGLQFFDICTRFNMEKLIDQVVNYMKTSEYENSWPPDLLRRIAVRNRDDYVNAIAENWDDW